METDMQLRISLFLFFLCYPCAVFSEALTKLENINIDEAEFYIFDITDKKTRAFPSVDAYRHQEKLYVAITPLFEGLRIKYSLIGNTLTVDFDGKSTELVLAQQSDSQGKWFHDGSFNFIQAELLEQLFSTEIQIDTSTLKLNLTGHNVDFPYKTLRKQKKQRRINTFILEEQYQENNTNAGVITVPDQYRLATVPTGYLDLEYQADNSKDNFTGVLQTVSDLAYHSANITLTRNDQQTGSRVEFTRYPQYTGDKILGIWDQYTFGDVWVNNSKFVTGSTRGLGVKFSANNRKNQHENMTTSFTINAKPGWEADIYHNSIFLESREVPNDGLMEFNDMNLRYGANEFKIVLYGPYGEQETIFERVNVRKNSLAQGDTAFRMSFVEQDSSLLDINLSEFDIDNMSANFDIGLLDNWQLGATVNIQNIHDDNNNGKSLLLINQVTLPGWFFENQLALNEQSLEQISTVATSFSNFDNFTLQYKSSSQEVNDAVNLTSSNIFADYHIRTGFITNNFRYEADDNDHDRIKIVTHRVNATSKYFNISNSISHKESEIRGESLTGSLSLTGRVNRNFRFISSIPYNLKADEKVNADNIRASFTYNYKDSWDNRHSFHVSNTSFFKNNNWTAGYNFSVLAPTHVFTLRTNYNSSDKWRVTAGISVNFGYDRFNKNMFFSHKTNRTSGVLDVHTYLDRRLNGIPDILDYDLADVTFIGNNQWESVKTNDDGRARLFGANRGVSALSTKWDSGGTTLNNDYLIYSHPGSLQKINLPFYLTTELEFFVVLNNEQQTLSLSNVPLVVSNQSTGDEYQGESDFDGYVSFKGLLPGEYHVFIDKQYLADKGFQADVGGFEFNSPLKGGFVVLPNIELSRSESGDIGANRLEKVKLDEDNYISLLEVDNDKLIHLPPKGAMKAPYSLDSLHLAKFKEIKMQSTEQERRELRNKLTAAAEITQHLKPSLTLTKQYTLKTEPDSVVSDQETTEAYDTKQKSSANLDKKIPLLLVPSFPSVNFTSVQDTQFITTDNLTTQDANVETSDSKLNLSSGYVVQYAALKSLDIATTLTQNFPNMTQLYIVRKVVKGESMYCLISQVFQDKTSAREYLKTAKKDGFIVGATKYLEPIWSK
jgi:hypothetical protein